MGQDVGNNSIVWKVEVRWAVECGEAPSHELQFEQRHPEDECGCDRVALLACLLIDCSQDKSVEIQCSMLFNLIPALHNADAYSYAVPRSRFQTLDHIYTPHNYGTPGNALLASPSRDVHAPRITFPIQP
jgi:hypothetical protein